MLDQREADLRQWIQEAAATSRPIKIDDVLSRASVDVDPITPAETASAETTFIVELKEESPVTNKRNLYLALAATAAAVVLIAFALTNGSTENVGVASQVETTSTTIAPSRVEIAADFWQALETGDREQALALVDPAAIDSPDVSLFGRGKTLEGVFDWYEVVGWNWHFDECVDFDDEHVKCSASASNLWSEALEVQPVSGNFLVRFSEDGISGVDDQGNSFGNQWSLFVFEKFADWVATNHPDDAATMFDFDVNTNQEILDLYEINTVRFVESQQAG